MGSDVAFTPTATLVTTWGEGLYTSNAVGYEPLGLCGLDPVPSALAVAPDDPSRVFVGYVGQGIVASTDGGQTLGVPASGIDDLVSTVVITGAAADPVVWLVSGAGLFRSGDVGENWLRVADDIGTLSVSAVAQDPADPTHVLMGTNGEWYKGSGLSRGAFDVQLAGEGSTVTRSTGLSGENPGIIGLAFDPLVPDRAFAYQQGPFAGDPNLVPTGLYRSTNGGDSFVPTPMVGTTMSGTIWLSRSPLDVGGNGALIMGARVDPDVGTVEVWRSVDGGVSHNTIWSGSTNGPYAGVYTDPNDNIFMAGPSPTGLKRSTDDGASFEDHGNLSGFSAMVRDMAFTPSGGILVGTVDGVYYAADGLVFVEMNEGFESFARGPETYSVGIVPGSPSVVFIGATHGVYRRRLP